LKLGLNNGSSNQNVYKAKLFRNVKAKPIISLNYICGPLGVLGPRSRNRRLKYLGVRKKTNIRLGGPRHGKFWEILPQTIQKRDKQWSGLGLDWIRSISNLFGLHPDCL